MSYCPTIACRGKKGKQVPLCVPGYFASKRKARFCALWTRGSKPDGDEDVDKLLFLSFSCYQFVLSGGYVVYYSFE